MNSEIKLARKIFVGKVQRQNFSSRAFSLNFIKNKSEEGCQIKPAKIKS